LIIDDASPDNTAEVAAELVKQDSRVVYRQHKVNQGHIATYNEGIEWASADYQLLLSADDYLLPGALSRATELMEKHQEIGFVFGKAITHIDGQILDLTKFKSDTESRRIFKGLEFIEHSGVRNIVPTPTAVIRTKLQKKLGGYRTELSHSGDMEMWLRLAAHASVGMIYAYQAVYRRHSANMSLEYLSNSWLPDLKQRKEAIDIFIENCSNVLPNAQNLRHKFLYLLAREAVGLSSSTFNEKEQEVSLSLSEFAYQIYPQIKQSLPWTKLVCKRALGYKAWSTLRAAAKIVRN